MLHSVDLLFNEKNTVEFENYNENDLWDLWYYNLRTIEILISLKYLSEIKASYSLNCKLRISLMDATKYNFLPRSNSHKIRNVVFI